MEGEGLIGNDVIFDYSKGYPMPQSVVGFDQKKYERLQDRDQRRKEQLEQESWRKGRGQMSGVKLKTTLKRCPFCGKEVDTETGIGEME